MYMRENVRVVRRTLDARGLKGLAALGVSRAAKRLEPDHVPIMPTILQLCGIDYERLSVGSLSPLWGSHPGDFERRPIFSGSSLYFEDRESVIFDGFKYIRSILTAFSA